MKTLENESSGINNGAKSWRTKSRTQELEHQVGATGGELRRDTDTGGWEGERSKWTGKFLL